MPSLVTSRLAKMPAALLMRTSIRSKRRHTSAATPRTDACEDMSAIKRSGAGPLAASATSAQALAPRRGSRQSIRTCEPMRASSRAAAKPMPLLAPVINTMVSWNTSGISVTAGRREHVDQVAVRIAKQHGAVAPRHLCRRLHPVVDVFLQPLVFGVDVLDFEIEDRGAVGRRLGDAFSIGAQSGAVRDRQALARTALEFHISAAQDRGGSAGYTLVESR